MKIRIGFVSNSSSSSFCFIGSSSKLKDIDPKSFKNKASYLVEFIGDVNDSLGNEGRFCVWIEDVRMLEYLKKHAKLVDSVSRIYAESGENDTNITKVIPSFPKNTKIFMRSFTLDQSSTSDVGCLEEMLSECYFTDGENGGEYDTVFLINTEDGHNKFYEMTKIDDDTFQARYGKIGTSGSIIEYPMEQWNKKLDEKLKKGYMHSSDAGKYI